MLSVNAPQDMAAHEVLGMTRGLRRAEFTGIAERPSTDSAKAGPTVWRRSPKAGQNDGYSRPNRVHS